MGPLRLPEALRLVGLRDDLAAEALPANWHGDRQWRVDGSMSLRLIRIGRSSILEDESPVSAAMVTRQVETGEAFRAAGIPFMRLLAGPVVQDDVIVLLYSWIPGAPVAAPTRTGAHAVGALLRRLHDVGGALPAKGLPVHDKAAAARLARDRICAVVPDRFARRAEVMIERAESSRRRTVVSHNDLNLPNLLWPGPDDLSGPDDLAGLVDLDQVGVTDPIAELAWVVKWWSRPAGVTDHGTDQVLAQAVFAGYGADRAERAATAPFLWLSGCLNLHGAERIRQAPPGERSQVVAALHDRADRLAGLAR